MISKTDISKSIHNPALTLRPINVIAGSSATITVESDMKDKIGSLWLTVTNTDDTALDVYFTKDSKGWTGTIPETHLEHFGHVRSGVVVNATIGGIQYKCGMADLNVIPDNPDAQPGEGTYHQLKIQLNGLQSQINRVDEKVDQVQEDLEDELSDLSSQINTVDEKVDQVQEDLEDELGDLSSQLNLVDEKVDQVQEDLSSQILSCIKDPDEKEQGQVLTYDGEEWIAKDATVEFAKTIVNSFDNKKMKVKVNDKGLVLVQQYVDSGYYGTVSERGDWFFSVEKFEIEIDGQDLFITFYGRIQDITNNGKIEAWSYVDNYVASKEAYVPDEFKYNGKYINVSLNKISSPMWTDLYRLIQDGDSNLATKLSELEDDIAVVRFSDPELKNTINLYNGNRTGVLNLGNNSVLDATHLNLVGNNSSANVGGSGNGTVKIGKNVVIEGYAEEGKSNIWIDGKYLIVRTPENTTDGMALKSVEVSTPGSSQSHIEWEAVDFPTAPTTTSQLTNDSGYITSEDVPTATSELTNDSGYITQNDLPEVTMTAELEDGSTVTYKIFGEEI